MVVLEVHLDGDNCWPDLKDKEDQVIEVEGSISIAALAGGMSSGAPSVAIRIDLPDGKIVFAQTSLALLLTAADLFKDKHGDPRHPSESVSFTNEDDYAKG